jgi:predicted DCC family thiol-disulfide oxidoreductase YuxK
MNEAIPISGWILYDGACGFCYWWVHFWERVVAKRGFALKDLQTAIRDGSLHIEAEYLLDDIRFLTADGKLIVGADAYLHVGRRIWWASPLAVVFGLPGFRQILTAGYSWFNRNRYRVSKHCPLPPRKDPF